VLKRPATPEKNVNKPESAVVKVGKKEEGEVKVSKRVFKGAEEHWWATDNKIKEILKIKIPEKITQV
jgi:hypothetical protein